MLGDTDINEEWLEQAMANEDLFAGLVKQNDMCNDANGMNSQCVVVSWASPSYIKERVWRMNLHPLVPRSSIRTTNEIAASSHVI